jgi:hypothetical protein
MHAKQLVEWELAEETKVVRENATLYHIVHPKSHDLTWDKFGHLRWEAGV